MSFAIIFAIAFEFSLALTARPSLFLEFLYKFRLFLIIYFGFLGDC